jgi:membrane-associated phospholipid phosphatase
MTKLNKVTLLLFIFGASFYWLSFEFWDKPIAQFFHHYSPSHFTYVFYSLITLLGDPKLAMGFIVIGFSFVLVFRNKYPQKQVVRYLLLIILAMIVAISCETILKYLLGRYRPYLLFHDGLYGFHFLSNQFLLNSSPSGHATRAFVLATGFSLIWKRFMPLFLLCGFLVGLSRLVLEFHFFSDVVFGSILGTLITLWTVTTFNSKLGPVYNSPDRRRNL